MTSFAEIDMALSCSRFFLTVRATPTDTELQSKMYSLRSRLANPKDCFSVVKSGSPSVRLGPIRSRAVLSVDILIMDSTDRLALDQIGFNKNIMD